MIRFVTSFISFLTISLLEAEQKFRFHKHDNGKFNA